MLLILIAIIATIFCAVCLANLADAKNSFLLMAASVILGIGAGFASLAYAFAGWSWLSAGYKADIINREYGTTYTKEEVFYASDVIDTIRQLDRKRYEVNGDILRGEEQKP